MTLAAGQLGPRRRRQAAPCNRPAGRSRSRETSDESRKHPDFSRIRLRRAFTLVELLVTVTIIVILAGTAFFAMSLAAEAGREQRTKATIATLHGLLMERYEEYATRRVPISTANDPAQAADERLAAIRELMIKELPDRWSDVTTGPSIIPEPALQKAYANKHKPGPKAPQYEGAECLYLIIMLATGDGEAREHFKDSQIGDVDNDGNPEILDGWGKPISFLRWAPAFSPASPLQTGNAQQDHDPFDPMRRDKNAFRLVPLIYSAGPDDTYDIEANKGTPSDVKPFDGPQAKAGKVLGDGAIDNIHNHLIGTN